MSELRNLDPFELSRRLEKSARRYGTFFASLPRQAATSDPFLGQEFPGKRHFDHMRDQPEADPLRTPSLRWIHHLVEARIHVAWRAQEAELEYRSLHPVREPEEGQFSLAEMRERALSGERGKPESWWRVRARFEGSLGAHRAQLIARQVEVAARLEIDDLSQFWSPLEESGDVSFFARRVLQETASDAESLWGNGWFELVEAALARPATEGWPARLTPDALRDLLGEAELYRGLQIEPGRLPSRFSPMSFPRAAGAIGRALSRALVRRDLPFVVGVDPLDLRGRELGSLLALWVISPAFLRTKLHLGQSQIAESQRAFRPALLAHLRLSAARVLVLESARRGPKQLQDDFPQVMDDLCGEELPPNAALVRFGVSDTSAADFVGALAALAWEEELRDEHDEDWYRNPRAQAHLREEMRLPPPRTTSKERCERGLEAALRRVRTG